MSEIHLIPDKTVGIQFGIFLTVLIGLSYLIFKPFKKLYFLRKEKTDNVLKEIHEIEERIKLSSAKYSEEIKKAHEIATNDNIKIRQSAIEKEQLIKNEARKEALLIIENARVTIENSKKIVLKEIEKDIPLFAEEIMNKLTKN